MRGYSVTALLSSSRCESSQHLKDRRAAGGIAARVMALACLRLGGSSCFGLQRATRKESQAGIDGGRPQDGSEVSLPSAAAESVAST